RGAFAHERDAQAVEYARQRRAARRVDIGENLLGRLLAHALERHQVVEFQIVKIGNVLYQAFAHQLIHQRFAHPVDVHYAARGPMQDRLPQARWAIDIDAAAGGFALHAHDLAAADWACRWHAERVAMLAFLHHSHHVRDNIAGALHQHGIADLDAQAFYFVFVMQCRFRYHHAAHVHRAKQRARRQRAGAPYADADIFDHGLFLARREFESDGPAGRSRSPAQ